MSRAAAIIVACLTAILVILALMGLTLHAAPDDNIGLRATVRINRAFTSPGSGLAAVSLATSGGRISLMGDSDAALVAWLLRHDGEQIVVTLVKESR